MSWNMWTKLIFVVYFEQDYRYIVIESTRKNPIAQRSVDDKRKVDLEVLKIKINIIRDILKSTYFSLGLEYWV